MELLFNSCITQAEVTRKYFSQKLLFRNKSIKQKPLRQFSSALLVAGVLWIGLEGMSLPNANALEISTPSKRLDERAVLAQNPGEKNAQLSPPIANSLRQDLSKRVGIPVGKLHVTEATRKTWSNGCLGLPKPGEFCTEALVEGWRVVLSDGNQKWVYRTDLRGRTYRMEKGDRSSTLAPTQIPANELPPALSHNAIFRTISSGGITGRTYETTLWNDGRLVRVLINPTALVKPEVRHLSPQQVRQFQQLLQKNNLARYHRLSYPAAPGSADYITVTLVSRSSIVRYADTIQNQLPEPLQAIAQAWNQLSQV
jgi:hypothetical protein